jgi:spermidine synthase
MYHVIGTGVAVSVLYFISFIFYRIGIFSLIRHRKIWNSVLAITFIITALAGLFLALQINYKWDLPIVKSILKWHVETGAGLAFTGIFHLIWHISYFTKIFKRTEEPRKQSRFTERSSSEISINLFITGFISMSVQILLLRELMNISGGYELTSGTFLASWLITSAIGAFAAGSSSLNDLRKINLLFSLSPIMSIILLLLLSRFFLQPGETPSFLVSMIFTFLVLIPFCLISGFTFVKLLVAAKLANGFVPGKSFSIETTGGIAAGFILTVLTAGIFNTYKLLLIIILMSVAYTILNYFLKARGYKLVIKITIALLAVLIIIFDPDILFRKQTLHTETLLTENTEAKIVYIITIS